MLRAEGPDIILDALGLTEKEQMLSDDFYEILTVSKIHLLLPKSEPGRMFYYHLHNQKNKVNFPFFFTNPILAARLIPELSVAGRPGPPEIHNLKAKEYFRLLDLIRSPGVVMNPTSGRNPGRKLFSRAEIQTIAAGPWGRRVLSA